MCSVPGLLLASTLLTAKSQYDQGQYASDAANVNARISEAQRRDAVVRGADEANAQRAKTRAFMASQRAAMGASGLAMNSGSFGDVLNQTAIMGETDAQTIKQNALREAWGYQVKSEDELSQGRMAKQAGSYNAFGTLLGGASKVWSSGTGGGLHSFRWR